MKQKIILSNNEFRYKTISRVINPEFRLERNYSYPTGILGYNIKTPFIALNPAGIITIYRGYSWDGPSGPTIATKSFMRGSLVHDALYQLMRMKLLPNSKKDKADRLLQEICKADGMWKFNAGATYHAVRIFGGRYANSIT